MATYYIKKNSKEKFFWTLDSDKNYETVSMSSESYESKQGAQKSIAWNQANGKTSQIIDLT